MPNTIVRNISPKSLFEDAKPVTSATEDYLQGDLLVFDGTNNIIKKPAAEAEGNTFLGIAQVAITDGRINSPYQGTDVDGSQPIVTIPGPVYGVVARCVLKTGITIAPGDEIFLDPATGSRGVTNTGTKAIGLYQGAAITSSVAGQEIEVLIGARYSNDVLKF